jgi:uncharacterized cupin superfamily protein
MYLHLQGRTAAPPVVPGDPSHVGTMTNRWSDDYESEDGLVELGYWEFEGEMWTPAWDGYELAIIVLEGSATLESDGTVYALESGDVLMQDCPIPEKIWRSEGVKAVWMRRWRSAALRDEHRASIPNPVGS